MNQFKRCSFEEIKPMVSNYYESNAITVDSYWEAHVVNSNHYQIFVDHKLAGFFAIHGQSMVTLFHLIESYAHLGQVVFEQVKRYEQVTNAFVATGDEFFLSHAIDNFARLEKQAYFSIYTDKDLPLGKERPILLKRVVTKEDTELFSLSKDFFDDDSAERILSGVEHFQVYKVESEGELVGFGVVETGRVVKTCASIGMYVMEEKRQMGYAASILKSLQRLVESEGYKARSGCWYYNHNSKKSMESAGAYSKTRLLRFYF